MTSIFLSYAREDDGEPFAPGMSFVVRLYRDLTKAGFAVWFDRLSMPSRTLTFHQEIRDAVAARDRLLLVVGPRAAESLYVAQEWQFAYFEAEKVVTPILRYGEYANVPNELKLLHCEDFREDGQYEFHLKNLIRQLAEPMPPLGQLIGVPSLPQHFLSRTDRVTALRNALRADLDRPVVITGSAARVGMHGMGGIGKSVLAATLAHDRKVREVFPDGIVWVGIGPLPKVSDLQRRVHKDLGGDGVVQTEHEGRVKLRDILKDKSVLLILDNVWRRQDVEWFDVLGPRCRAIITTRDAGLFAAVGGVHHQVELLTDAESLNLLTQAAGVDRDKLPSEAADLIAECGRLPLAIALCGGLIRYGFAWAKVLEQLHNSRIDRIKNPHAANVEHESIWNSIDVSVRFLNSDEQTRFLELAAFPPNEAIPIAAIRTFWSHTAEFDDWDTDSLVIKLSQRSLLELMNSTAGRMISLHDLVYDYIWRSTDDPKALHNRLLVAYGAKCIDAWPSGPNDGYFYTHLRYHLIAAGRGSELAELLHELSWLEAKNAAGLAFDLPHDFKVAIEALPTTDDRRRVLALLNEALRRELHFIHRHRQDYPQGLFQCLWNIAWWYDAPAAANHYEAPKGHWTSNNTPLQALDGGTLYRLLEVWRSEKVSLNPTFLWVRSLRPPLPHLGTSQQAVLRGHEGDVMAVAVDPNGKRVASGSRDETLRVWDVETGAELLRLQGSDMVLSVSFSPDGDRLASGSMYDKVRLWNVDSGVELHGLGGLGAVDSVSFSPDGRHLAFCSRGGGGVRLWDTETGAEVEGKSPLIRLGLVTFGLTFSPNGMYLAGGGSGTVYLWDAETGAEVRRLKGHRETVTSVAFSPDGKRLASGSDDMTVRLWDAETGLELSCLKGHTKCVNSVAFSAGGRLLASGSDDKTIRLWDVELGQGLSRLEGHTGDVNEVAFSRDGRILASGSDDRSVRLWDMTAQATLRKLKGHLSDVRRLAHSADGKWLATGSRDGDVCLWDVETGLELHRLEGHTDEVYKILFSPDGKRLISQTLKDGIRLWNVETGAELRWLQGRTEIALSPDGKWLALAPWRGNVHLWDLNTGAELHLLRWTAGISCLSFSSDGKRLAAGSGGGNVRLWDMEAVAELHRLEGDSGEVYRMYFSPDGSRLAVWLYWEEDAYGAVLLWDAEAGVKLAQLDGYNLSPWHILELEFSPDGSRLSARKSDDTVCLWDAELGACLNIVIGEGNPIAQVQPTSSGWKAYRGANQTIIQTIDTGESVAWVSLTLDHTTQLSDRIWAGFIADYVCLFVLEGQKNADPRNIDLVPLHFHQPTDC